LTTTHRTIQHWDHWLSEGLGKKLLEAEREFLPSVLSDCYGRHALLIGVPHQVSLLKFTSIPQQVLLSPLLDKNKTIPSIESDYTHLAIASASVDLVLVPHSFEFLDNPQQLITEACRIVKPEGYIIIFGFNPLSLWGIKKSSEKHNKIPWSLNFISPNTVKNWLLLSDFQLVKQNKLLFRPPIQHHAKFYEKLKIMEWLGSKLWTPFGGVYMLMAQAKVIPLTPIKVRWQQKLSGIQVTLPGPSIRNWP